METRDVVDEFAGKTAVVTGAASGIGRGLAERFAEEKMRVVLSDVEEKPLRELEEQLLERGAEVIAVQTDVRKLESIEELQRRAVEAFGKVHVLCNNAGVGTGGLSWEQPLGDWEWVLGVNLWGVIHGVRTFVPGMIAHGEPGHVVNTASVLGLLPGPFQSVYSVAKYGVVALSECLFYELQIAGSKLGVSVLCPGPVATNIVDSSRNRPQEFGPGASPDPNDAGANFVREMIAAGLAPSAVADMVVDAIRSERLYILTHPQDYAGPVRERAEAIAGQRNPAMMPVL